MSASPLRKKVPPHPLTTVTPEPGLLTIAAAADRLGIATRTAYEWANAGQLPGLVVVNNRRYVRRIQLERFLAGE